MTEDAGRALTEVDRRLLRPLQEPGRLTATERSDYERFVESAPTHMTSQASIESSSGVGRAKHSNALLVDPM